MNRSRLPAEETPIETEGPSGKGALSEPPLETEGTGAAPMGAASPAAASGPIVHELTRSVCPRCRRVVDAQVILRDGRVYMSRRCPEHGPFEALIYGDAETYVDLARFERPGKLPLRYATEVARGCPHDCGLCPEHKQHACVGIIEINSACDMECPLCFADAGAGFNLTLEEVEHILDRFVAAEGSPEVVQFSGGEPTIHPQILPMLRAAREREIRVVMLNTNGRRIARDDEFLAELAEIRPAIYFQFDGFEAETYGRLRGERDLLEEKLLALDRLAEAGCLVLLVPAVERGVNEHELGRIIRFALDHPAVLGINFQPAFHAGRFGPHDPLERVTNPEILALIEAQTDGLFVAADFVPVPCCYPTCNAATHAYVEDDVVLPLPRLFGREAFVDPVTNRVIPELGGELRKAFEGLWSTAAVPGSEKTMSDFALSCAACGIDVDLGPMPGRMFMIMLQDFMDPWTFNERVVKKCCKEILLPDGKQIPFCAYNSVGYREQARVQLAGRQRARQRAERAGEPFEPSPLEFTFAPPAGA